MDFENHIPVAAPIDSDSAGRGGCFAVGAVMRVISNANLSTGTGFLHKSGMVITAEHVVKNSNDVVLVLSDLTKIAGKVEHGDTSRDLALIRPSKPVQTTPLTLSNQSNIAVGAQVSTWGYPVGYRGAQPMLSVGYLAAIDGRVIQGELIKQWVVNAAFNSGNSGGPLLLIETGEVIGVVSSKLAPISREAMNCLNALKTQNSGLIYQSKDKDGNVFPISEGQIVARVLEELRQQIQLVIGHAACLDDMILFLRSYGIDP